MTCFVRLSKWLLLFCLLALPARAADKAQDQSQLKAMSASLMAVMGDLIAGPGWTPVIHGDTLVEDSGNYYAVTLPHLAFKDARGQTLEVGLIAVNAMAGDASGQWKITIALPSPITMNDEKGAAVLSFVLGQQTLSGLYNAVHDGFSALKGHYQNVEITVPQSGIKTNLPALDFTAAIRKDEAHVWSGSVGLSSTGGTVTFQKTGSVLSLGTVNVSGAFDHYALSSAALLQRQIDARNPAPFLLKLMAATATGVARNAALSLTATNTALRLPARQSGGKDTTLNLNTLQWGYKGSASGVHIMSGFSGLKIDPSDSDLTAILPEHLNLDADIGNIPAERILREDLSSKDALSQRLASAKTSITIKNSLLGNSVYEVDLDGTQTAADTALGWIGNGTLKVSGIEALTLALSGQLQNGNTPPDLKPYLRDVQNALLVMTLTGQPGIDSKGKPAKQYTIQNTADGKMLLNGQDLQGLMKMVPKKK